MNVSWAPLRRGHQTTYDVALRLLLTAAGIFGGIRRFGVTALA